MKSPGTKSCASSPGPYRSTVVIVKWVTPNPGPSPGVRHLVEGSRAVGINAAGEGHPVREQLSEHRKRERGQLLGQPGVEADRRLSCNLVAGSIQQAHHPAPEAGQTLSDRFHAGRHLSAPVDEHDREPRLDHRDGAVLEI